MNRQIEDAQKAEELKMAVAELMRLKTEKASLDSQQKKVETWILSQISATELGKTSFMDESGNEVISITNSITYKVDGDKLDELARSAGMEAQIPYLFRFKAEVNAEAWKRAAEDVRKVFAEAVTATLSKPTISTAAIEAKVKEYKKSLI